MTDGEKPKILIVDDSLVIRNAVAEILESDGYSVSQASDGVEGLRMVRSERFDLMLLDIDMPLLSGLSVLRSLRNDPLFREFPVVMLSARSQKKDEFWGRETGANAYLIKPPQQETLTKTIRDVIENAKRCRENGVICDTRVDTEKPREDKADIVTDAGEVLDRQLFRMTLINRVYAVAMTHDTLVDTCRATSEIFASIIKIDMFAMLVVQDEEHVKLLIYSRESPTVEELRNMRRNVISLFSETTRRELSSESIDVVIEPLKGSVFQEDNADEEKGFQAMMLESKTEKYGLFTLARNSGGEFTEEEIELMNIIVGQLSLIVDNVRMYEKIKSYAIADGLTGLYNHRYFHEQLDREFSRTRRFNLSLTCIIIDIDQFKIINDTYGHQSGDVIIRGISAIIKRSVRDIDTTARYGGDEFTIILPETTRRNAYIVAERIRANVERTVFHCFGKELHVTVSLGLSGMPDDDALTHLELVEKADKALYTAKRLGRNRACLFTPQEGSDE